MPPRVEFTHLEAVIHLPSRRNGREGAPARWRLASEAHLKQQDAAHGYVILSKGRVFISGGNRMTELGVAEIVAVPRFWMWTRDFEPGRG